MKTMSKDLLFLFLILTTFLNRTTTKKVKFLSAKELAMFREKNLKINKAVIQKRSIFLHPKLKFKICLIKLLLLFIRKIY
jgi:hypothetical protein